jgi:mono/diheme cytochrome c family protein
MSWSLTVHQRRARSRHRWPIAAIAALLLGDVVRGQSTSNGRDEIAPTKGKALYESACMSCHGADGRGAPRSAVGFDLALPDFTDCRFATPEPDADWQGIIQHGGPIRRFDRRMPAFGEALSNDEIAQIVAYLRGFCPDPAWPRGDLNLPRPLVTEKAFPENEAVLTTSVDRSDGTAVGNVFVYERRIGPRSQYEVVVPLNLRTNADGGWEQGLGDVAVALKHALFHDNDRGTIVSAGAEVTFPTGKEALGLGGGQTIFEPFAVLSPRLPRDGFVHLHGGFEFPRGDEPASNEAFWRTAVGWTLTANGGAGRSWSPMIEMLAARDLEKDAKTRWDLVPQMQVSLSTRGHVMVNAGLQFPVNEREGRGKKFLVYLLWDWFDGGFFSGW